MKFSELIKEIESGDFSPIYLLHGKEPYFMERIVEKLSKKVVPEGQRDFNVSTMYGKDTEVQQVVDQARRVPMMAERQLIILKEAQEMSQIDELLSYVEHPTPSTVLVMIYKHKRLDQRTKLAKAIKENGLVFESKPVYDNQLPGWIMRYVKNSRYEIEKKAALMIAEYLGSDLEKLVNEIEKIFLNIERKQAITTDDVEQYIGISKDYNIFELHEALARKDILKANQIIRHFNANPREFPLLRTTAMLYNFFSDTYAMSRIVKNSRGKNDYAIAKKMGKPGPFFIRNNLTALKHYTLEQLERIIHLLLEYDLRAKGVENARISHESLQEELVWHILHIERSGYAVPARRPQ